MARPLRALHRSRTRVRRRHRTWMLAMVLASLGWGVWWVLLIWHQVLEHALPPLGWVYGLTTLLGLAGVGMALFTIRARRIWVLLAAVPLVANGSLLSVPLLFHSELRRYFDAEPGASGFGTGAPDTNEPDAGGPAETGPGDGAPRPAGG